MLLVQGENATVSTTVIPAIMPQKAPRAVARLDHHAADAETAVVFLNSMNQDPKSSNASR